MNKLNKFRLSKKLTGIGRLSWDLLVFLSKISVGVFLFISLVAFWIFLSVYLYYETGINLSNQIKNAFRIFILILGVIVADWTFSKLEIRDEKT